MEAIAALRVVQSRFAGAHPELPNGFAEHAPMGADALLALGVAPDAVVRWAARHEPVPIGHDDPLAARRRALLAELERSPWPEVARAELATLMPRLPAHLFHGLIRTGHAVRGLRAGVDEVGLAELATALAAWRAWAGEPGRAPAGPRVEPAGDPVAAVLDAARRGAGACAASPSIVNLHAVTAPMAFLLLADLLDADTLALGAAAFARSHARHGAPVPSERSVPPGADRLAALVDRWDAHPAKLTEAALRGFAATGDGVFLDAAAAIMGPWPTTTPLGSTPTSSPPGSA